jgi:hypothetical protein
MEAGMNKIAIAAATGALCALAAVPGLAAPVAYHALVVTDVGLNGTVFHNAVLRIDQLSDTRKVTGLNGSSTGVTNASGSFKIRIDTGNATYVGRFSAGQIAAVIDIPNLVSGFSAGAGYALLVSEAGGRSGGHTTVGALADILATPADQANYTPQTLTLGTDLKTASNLTGAALSCAVAPTPEVSVDNDGVTPMYSTFGCPSSAPVVIRTDIGKVQIYAPYVDLTDGSRNPYSLNWGVFWVELPPTDD